ncbi:helix-turn-helix domain-containing protein [Streptomyces sp. SHP 1-2]|uniref:helix-turn-helix domain-containing protein n=1 Tax=Streptomyces sp. SHP 1-2 TaxID=2769489 RepID=UPI002238F0C8|nr:helix-turn-helix domain-containing protein [Streptomyces sp. SHP 1-2]MCW5252233.1 hypothetical protein [Streptomyces sp. SHP 1-2]
MSAVALAAAEAAPHTPPPRAAEGALPRAGGLTIRVPLRLVVGAQYPDTALSVYVKIAALALRPEGCTAKVATLADYLGMSKSGVERGLKPLRRPDPVDGVVEIPTTQRTARGGTGESAHRTVRPLDPGELWVRIPVRAAEALSPRLLRLYALLAYATARRVPVTVAELAGMLRHHTGPRAGEPLTEMSARRLVDDLDATGWATVHRRQGPQGRHAYETHRHPLHAAPAPAAPGTAGPADDQEPEQLPLWGEDTAASPFIHDGPGPSDHDGSLASKEDHPTDRPDETTRRCGSRRRRGDRKWAPAPVDKPTLPDAFGPGTSRAPRGNRPPLTPADQAHHNNPNPNPGSYTGPDLRWAPRIHTALAPVRHELDGIRRFVLRRIAREIGRQLDTGISPERMAARIQARYRRISPADIRDTGAWLLAVGITARGCGVPSCEDGTEWPTGRPCETCAHQRQLTTAWWRQARYWETRLQELRAQRPAAPAPVPARPGGEEPDAGAGGLGPGAGGPVLPAKKTYRQRDAASDAEILAAAAEHGPAVALHLYGHLRTLPLLRRHNHPS